MIMCSTFGRYSLFWTINMSIMKAFRQVLISSVGISTRMIENTPFIIVFTISGSTAARFLSRKARDEISSY